MDVLLFSQKKNMDVLLMPGVTFVVVKLTVGLSLKKKKKKTHRWTRIWQSMEFVGITRLISDTRCISARYNGSTLKNPKVSRTDLRKKKKNSSQERLSVRVSQTTRQPQPKKGRESIGIERVSSNDELVQIIGGHDPSPLHCVPPPQDSHHEILCWYILCSCSIASSFSFSLLPFQVNVAWLCCSCMVLIWFQLMLQ